VDFAVRLAPWQKRPGFGTRREHLDGGIETSGTFEAECGSPQPFRAFVPAVHLERQRTALNLQRLRSLPSRYLRIRPRAFRDRFAVPGSQIKRRSSALLDLHGTPPGRWRMRIYLS